MYSLTQSAVLCPAWLAAVADQLIFKVVLFCKYQAIPPTEFIV